MSLAIAIIDDEQPARARLRALVGELTSPDFPLSVAGEAANGMQALELAAQAKPDMVLLDIRMPGMDGLEVARHLALLPDPPAVVFTTAHDEYAMRAFEAEAIGYLLKPVRKEMLLTALERARRLTRRQLALVESLPAPGVPSGKRQRTQVAIRVRDGLKLVRVADILYFAADQKYTTVRHTGGSDLIEESLRALEDEFVADFVRVHRNALVNKSCVTGIDKDADGQHFVRLRDVEDQLQISRRQAGEIKGRLGL
ncbi:MAG: LytTR family DNA-binding domain-containing protein [Steroidobacteraceae bacterium]